jgi:hypothetical protein
MLRLCAKDVEFSCCEIMVREGVSNIDRADAAW